MDTGGNTIGIAAIPVSANGAAGLSEFLVAFFEGQAAATQTPIVSPSPTRTPEASPTRTPTLKPTATLNTFYEFYAEQQVRNQITDNIGALAKVKLELLSKERVESESRLAATKKLNVPVILGGELSVEVHIRF